MAPERSKVHVLYTGGTIGMLPKDPDDPGSPLAPGDLDRLQQQWPDVRERGIDLTFEHLRDLDGRALRPIDSSNVTPNDWVFMANAIAEAYDDHDGFVILHGTDTMAYTASALSFMLVNQAKPVVVTGSHLPIADAGTDAVTNVLDAMHIAGHRATDVPLVPEVMIVFGGSVLRGNRARKMRASFQSFESPNVEPLGTFGENTGIDVERLLPVVDNEHEPFSVRSDLDTRVADITLFPGIRSEQLDPVLGSDDIQGVVLRTFGAGNASNDPALLAALDTARDTGKIVVSITQCPQGSVKAGRYEAGMELLERGVIAGADLTPEAALTKLMVLLGNEPRDHVAALMQQDIRGELTPQP